MFLAIIYILLFYELAVRLLITFKMKGSFEWLLVKLQDLFKGVKSSKIVSDLLGDEIQWISYKNGRVKEKAT